LSGVCISILTSPSVDTVIFICKYAGPPIIFFTVAALLACPSLGYKKIEYILYIAAACLGVGAIFTLVGMLLVICSGLAFLHNSLTVLFIGVALLAITYMIRKRTKRSCIPKLKELCTFGF
jgi:hypothetical protein